MNNNQNRWVGRRERAEQLLRFMEMRDVLFDNGHFQEPGWTILLVLYVKEHEGAAQTVSQLCKRLVVPPARVLRELALLIDQGLLVTSPDGTNPRKVYVELASHAVTRIEQLLESGIQRW